MTEEIREGTVEEEIAILGGEMKCMKAELGEEVDSVGAEDSD
jgi:hypothetical protein